MKEKTSDTEQRSLAERSVSAGAHSLQLGPAYQELPQHEIAQPMSAQHLAASLPPLIGRERELAMICALLGQPEARLITLAGPGGVGKTRLALKALSEVGPDYADGIVLVSLASAHAASEVIPAVAIIFGLAEKQPEILLAQLMAVLQHKRMLLLLDGFEEVIGAAPQLHRLLSACPGLVILVTSQTVLGMLEERVFSVLPLALPSPTRAYSCAELGQIPAVALFLERASVARPNFTLTPANLQTVAQICARLDGLPLALELAAARLRLFSPHELLARLDHRLSVLTGGPRGAPERHQSLRKTVERSYRLLTVDEQRLFRRLAVFKGGCTFQAIEAMTRLAGKQREPLLDATASLINQSMILHESQHGTEEQRFILMGAFGEYALEMLQASDEEGVIRQAHAEYYLGLAHSLEQKVVRGELLHWVGWIKSEYENLQAAFHWFLASNDAERALSLGGSLWPLWLQSSTVEGYHWIQQALERCPESSTPVQVDTKAWAMHTAAMLGYYKGNWAAADALASESLQLFRSISHAHGIARVLITQGIGMLLRGQYHSANRLVEEGIRILPRAQHSWLFTEASLVLAYSTYFDGNAHLAYMIGKDCVRLVQQSGELYMMIRALHAQALFAQAQGNEAEVAYLCDEVAEITRATVRAGVGAPFVICLIGLGAVAAIQRQYVWAVRLWARARMIYKRGDGISEMEPYQWLEMVLKTHLLYANGVDDIRAALSDQAFAAACGEGESLPLDQLLDKPELPRQAAAAAPLIKLPSCAGDLTPREREVLQLLAQGLSNALIAEQLVIGLTTVNSHVRTIYRKLDVSSRSAATRYALEHRLG